MQSGQGPALLAGARASDVPRDPGCRSHRPRGSQLLIQKRKQLDKAALTWGSGKHGDVLIRTLGPADPGLGSAGLPYPGALGGNPRPLPQLCSSARTCHSSEAHPQSPRGSPWEAVAPIFDYATEHVGLLSDSTARRVTTACV